MTYALRDPSLGGSELQKMGGFFCTSDSISAFGPDRVAGTVGDGKEEELGGHRISYSLRFHAPVAKATPPTAMTMSTAGDAPMMS